MQLQHLVLGFELELYAPEEFCMMYWCASWAHMSRDTAESWQHLWTTERCAWEHHFLAVKGGTDKEGHREGRKNSLNLS